MLEPLRIDLTVDTKGATTQVANFKKQTEKEVIREQLLVDISKAQLDLKALQGQLKATTGENKIKVGVDIVEAQSNINKLKGQLREIDGTSFGQKISSSIGSAFAGFIGPAAIIAGLTSISSSITRLAGNLEQAKISFTTMLGSADNATKLLADLSDFAKTTPFELTGIRENAKQLLAMGVNVDNLIPTMKALGDVSAGLSVPLDRLALAYGQVLAKGRLQGGELKQFTEAGVPLLETLSTQLGKSTAEISKMVETGQISAVEVTKAFQTMTEEGGKFENLMAKQSMTLQGMWSNLIDTLTQLGERIGMNVLPEIKKVVDGLLALANEYGAGVESVFTNFTTTVTDIVKTVGGAINDSIQFFVGLFNTLIGGEQKSADETIKFGQMVLLVIDSVANGFKTLAFGATALGKIIVTSLSYAFVKIEEGFKKTVNKIVGGINTISQGVNDLLGTSIGQLASFDITPSISMSDAYKDTFAEIEGDFGKLSSSIKSSTDKILSSKSRAESGLSGMKGIDLSKINSTGGGGSVGGGKKSKTPAELELEAQKEAEKEAKKIEQEKIARTNEKYDRELKKLTKTESDTRANADKIVAIEAKREADINKIKDNANKNYLKIANDQIKKNEDIKKSQEQLADATVKSYESIKSEIEKSQKALDDYDKKIGDTKQKIADLQASTSESVAQRVVDINKELKDEKTTQEERIKLQEELALATKNTSPEEIAKQEAISKESPTEKLLREAGEKKLILEQEVKDLEAQKASELEVFKKLNDEKMALEAFAEAQKIDYHAKEMSRLDALAAKLKEINILRAGGDVATLGAGGTTTNNTTTNNKTVNVNVRSDIDVESTARRL